MEHWSKMGFLRVMFCGMCFSLYISGHGLVSLERQLQIFWRIHGLQHFPFSLSVAGLVQSKTASVYLSTSLWIVEASI